MNPAILDTLLQLFEHVHHDPDSLPTIPIDEWDEGSVEWRLLESFRGMAEQVQQRIHQLRQSEQHVREQEELYHSAFDATNDGLFIGDLEGTIVEVNPAACKMYGYTHEEMIGLTGFHLNHPDSHPLIEELNATLPSPGTRLRLVAVRKDGTTFHTEGQVAVFPYKGKLHRVAAVRDISTQVQAEEQLREKEEQYRSIFEATTDGLTINDLEDGHVVEANPAACQMYGYAYDEMIGLPLTATIHPDSFHHVTEVLQAIPEGGHYQARLIALRKDGTTFHVDGRGTPFIYKGRPHLLGVIRDITAQVQAEEQLREREEQYRGVFETTYDGLVISDLENGCYVEVNPAFCRMFGYTREELIGMHSSALAAPVDHHLVDEVLETLKEGQGYQTVVGQGLRKDGTMFYVESQGTTFTYRGRPHSLAVVRDITERVRAEQQLREREEQYRGIFEATTDGLIISDWNGTFIEVNPAACRMFGYRHEEFIGLTPTTTVHPDDLPQIAASLQTIQAGGQAQARHIALRKDGTTFPAEVNGTMFMYNGKPHSLGVVRDITERIEAEQQLREKEEQYRGIFEAATDAMFITTLESGVIVEANPAACEMLSYSYEELIGLSPSTIVHPDSLSQAANDLQVLQEGEAASGNMILQRKDGSTFPTEGRSTIFAYKGRPHVLAVLRDITDRVEAERQLREREEQYRSVFEATSDGLDVLDLNGFLVEVNPAFCQIYGYTREELIGMNVSTLVPPASHSIATEGMETLKAGRDYKVTANAQGLRKDGTIFSAEAHGIPFTYRGQRHILGVVRDITERVEAEQQLREREALYRGIFEATYDALGILDLDGYIVEANPAVCQMLGYTREEIIGLHVSVINAPASQSIITEGLETLKAGSRYSRPALAMRKDGTVFPYDAHGSPITYRGQPHSLVVARDITEQVQAQELLEQRVEERTRELASLLEISHVVASTLQLKPLVGLILDQLKMVVDYTGASILTVERDDLVFLDSRSPTPEEQLMQLRLLPQRLGPIWEAITSGESLLLPDVHAESPLAQSLRLGMGGLMDTTFSYVRACLFVPLTLKDQTIGMLVLTSSETAAFTQHHADLALAIANQAAIAIENARLYAQAQQLAAVDERQRLARELHDSVSQALYGISLGVHTARMQLDRDPKDLAESLDYVLELAEAALIEMRALIFELRPESLENEGLVTALTKQAAALQARQHIAVHTDLCAEPEIPLKVKQDLYRVAQEALHNTVKHAHASKVELRLQLISEAVILEVCDNGRGFDATTSFPGHLGLHSMQERVTGLGGELRIKSTPGQGTCICVQVPVHDTI